MNIELNDLKMAIKMRFASVWQTVDGKVVSFDSVFEEALNCLSEFGMFRALKSEQKEAISSLVSGLDLLAFLPTGFGKSLTFQVLVRMREIRCGNLRA